VTTCQLLPAPARAANGPANMADKAAAPNRTRRISLSFHEELRHPETATAAPQVHRPKVARNRRRNAHDTPSPSPRHASEADRRPRHRTAPMAGSPHRVSNLHRTRAMSRRRSGASPDRGCTGIAGCRPSIPPPRRRVEVTCRTQTCRSVSARPYGRPSLRRVVRCWLSDPGDGRSR